ncbi:MAG: isoprenylcysteine carboxylmethyltransferase family protein [Cyanobacteria bacterium]|nr:isoprenylcysteine carboxylmethyltransferase family protein [Cyanobacteriota bacterium]
MDSNNRISQQLTSCRPVAGRGTPHSLLFRWRGWLGGLLLAPAVVIALFSGPIVAERPWQGVALTALGYGVFMTGAALRFWATLYIGGRKQAVVISDGPYSLCRHPLYVGSLLVAAGAALLLQSILVASAFIAFSTAYMLAVVPAEEAHLRAFLGPEYERYCRRVPAYVPSFRSFRTPPRIEVDVHALRLEAARASRWIWVPVLVQALGYLRAQPWWPHLFVWG